MADKTISSKPLPQVKHPKNFIQEWVPKIMGTREPNPRTIIEDGLIQDLDVAIPQLPVILNYSLCGKDGAVDICAFPPSPGLDPSRISKYYTFEAADPGWWCKNGYAVAFVDARGSHQSEGNKSYYGKDVGLDGYDIVQWLSGQSWSNGKIALYGASAYAMVTWLVAAERPPALAAIIPVDGMTDIYREMAFKAGIPENQFNETYALFWNWGKNLVEDSLYGLRERPYFDQYWQSKKPALNNIQCPAYIICGWGDHGIHTRGTLNAWKEISSDEKYMEIHQYQKWWEWAVTAESLGRQKSFLDRYLLNHSQNEVKFWPKSGDIVFDLPITGTSLEFAGHAKLRLWVEAQGAENMDLFITLRTVDRNGNQVFFPWITIIDNGPIGFGFMRLSRRELDEKLSTTYQPIRAHQRDLKLNSGEIVPVDIEIQLTSCRLRAGERLQLFISGHDYGTYPSGIPVPRHTDITNQGKHVIHFGGRFGSHLLLPITPHEPDAYSETKKTFKMAVVATRMLGDTDENLIYQYTKVHADMTRKIASEVPILRNYT
ncbi:hypothetical protein FANTH_11693 [Fusarium anthophilum]|uniref:Xaa-Pro dipeptidyl-peptidase C-terminal domain-containing protein n=1 Tax=Fusarium anthophilum TaxID=48485 RepID=A0A8H4YWV7_9HYPO|nr:hypothetical protein FANTH_11693 [Fusarium anthophilum]